MDLPTQTAASSTLAKENGRAFDEPRELKNVIVNSDLARQCTRWAAPLSMDKLHSEN
jgi:hypothetical protein